MSDAAVLAEIKRLAARGRIRYTFHAIERMDERGATRADVIHALASATTAEPQATDRFRVSGGVDRDGDDLTVIAAVEDDVIVITVF